MSEIEITAADREAAESIEWVQTTIDDHQSISEAFARHRLQARADALEEAAKVAEAFLAPPSGLQSYGERIATVIRSLITQGDRR